MVSMNPQFSELQASARARFQALGLPTRRMEDWHYTDLARLLPRAEVPKKPGAITAPAYFAAAKPLRLVFVDGILDTAQSDIAALAQLDGISITPIQEDTASLAFPEEDQDDALLAANLGYMQDGAIISVTGQIAPALELVWVGSHAAHAAYGRVCLNLAQGASLRLIETHCGAGVTHLVNDIEIGAGAKLTHIKLHEGANNHAALVMTRMSLAAGAQLQNFALCLSAALGRHEMRLVFKGRGASANMGAAILGCKQQHMDITTELDHAVAETTSQTLVRSVLTDKARGVFQGKVIVRPDAQRVSAEQQTAALMLSAQAEMNAKPSLEIFADDVACAHGSSIGEIDRDVLFFLRNRGLSEDAARCLLVKGFLDETLTHVTDKTLRAALEMRLANALAASFADAETGLIDLETDLGTAS